MKSVSELEAFLKTDEVALIGYFEKDDSPLSASFHTVAKKLRDKVKFGHAIEKQVLEKEGYK